MVTWILSSFGITLIKEIRWYLRNKPLGQETILDLVYAQLLEYYIGYWFSFFGFQTFTTLIGNLPWALALIIGWWGYSSMVLFAINLLISAFIRFMIVFHPLVFINFSDENILLILRIISFGVTVFIDLALILQNIQPGMKLMLGNIEMGYC